MVGDRPNHSGASGLGCTQPHVPERKTPKTNSASPLADSSVPTRSRCGRVAGGVSAMRRATNKMTATMTTSPANTQRHEKYVVTSPPMSGPAATAIAPADATMPYARGRSAVAKFDATSATIAGMISTAPMPSRNDQPRTRTREVRREGGGERARGVDHAADREGAAPADQRADLAAGDHERRHDERIERDRGLDPGHGRVEVLGDRRDRHVHHGTVERHEELPGRERQQHGPRGFGCRIDRRHRSLSPCTSRAGGTSRACPRRPRTRRGGRRPHGRSWCPASRTVGPRARCRGTSLP